MLKRAIVLLTVICIIILLSSCGTGYTHISDPDQYNRNDGHRTVSFLPESIDDYTVNEYSYTNFGDFGDCAEIFLDITVSEEQFHELITAAKQHSGTVTKPAYYDESYTEIVYCDEYDMNSPDGDSHRIGNAHIEKVIYDSSNCNIIYEYFLARDTGVYFRKDIAYFSRFGIDENEYFRHSERYSG